ncbi:hypothetical protein BLNAU_6626 [Blattamonas nauphoetae]|uniref:Uncharacterized protein n=1 Tax=Blattamonas nauphoetae TaxID=2049346 RepID=A0ABQ9Y3P6_9EUKA|nr:hypothetical protein BLNAU_6626 [Blattamonas nauphoetae]
MPAPQKLINSSGTPTNKEINSALSTVTTFSFLRLYLEMCETGDCAGCGTPSFLPNWSDPARVGGNDVDRHSPVMQGVLFNLAALLHEYVEGGCGRNEESGDICI